MLKKIISSLIFIPLLLTNVFGQYKLVMPKSDASWLYQVRHQEITYSADQAEQRILGTVDLINRWLWISLGFICFGFAMYNGFVLVTSRGNADGFKKAMKWLMGAAVGIVICFLSYGIVRVIINILP